MLELSFQDIKNISTKKECPKCKSINVKETTYVIDKHGEKDYSSGSGKCLDCGWDYMIVYLD